LPLGLGLGWWATSGYGIAGMAATLVIVEATSLVLLAATLRRSVR
jgi:hypothetical protein